MDVVGDPPNLGGDDHDYGDNIPFQLFTILDTFERYFFAKILVLLRQTNLLGNQLAILEKDQRAEAKEEPLIFLDDDLIGLVLLY